MMVFCYYQRTDLGFVLMRSRQAYGCLRRDLVFCLLFPTLAFGHHRSCTDWVSCHQRKIPMHSAYWKSRDLVQDEQSRQHLQGAPIDRYVYIKHVNTIFFDANSDSPNPPELLLLNRNDPVICAQLDTTMRTINVLDNAGVAFLRPFDDLDINPDEPISRTP
jgi:hypothetical protein